MPVKQRIRHRVPASAESLLSALSQEWQAPTTEPAAPTIVEDVQHGSLHVYVIWDQWGDLSIEERGAIILAAFETVHGAERLSEVTVALGLSAEQAERMGLEVE